MPVCMQRTTSPDSDPGTDVLPHAVWQDRRSRHRERLAPFVESFRYWRTRGRKHPIYDFLFSYYSFSTGQLLRWSPGIEARLELNGANAMDDVQEWPDHFRVCNLGNTAIARIDSSLFPERRIKFLEWALKYLEGTRDRAPIFHCFGLHEWAMVYKSRERHHPDTPLRVSADEISDVVQTNPVCCTHYDAYRFFTPEAVPLNRHELSREDVMDYDQPGCIHANMDLYKIGYKIAPFISSDLLGDLFLLARRAREIDMQASPYELSKFSVDPIKIETKEGRAEYLERQRELYAEAQPLRARLIREYRTLYAMVVSRV